MKYIIYISIFFISVLSFAQGTNTISGYLSDFESSNEALIFAKISIKENGMEVLSDENGFFKFTNLEDGEYTLISRFIGYETKESKIKITSNKTDIRLTLKPSTISIEDLNSVMASVGNTANTNK